MLFVKIRDGNLPRLKVFDYSAQTLDDFLFGKESYNLPLSYIDSKGGPCMRRAEKPLDVRKYFLARRLGLRTESAPLLDEVDELPGWLATARAAAVETILLVGAPFN